MKKFNAGSAKQLLALMLATLTDTPADGPAVRSESLGPRRQGKRLKLVRVSSAGRSSRWPGSGCRPTYDGPVRAAARARGEL